MDKDIILVNKPKGISSFDVIRILRKQLGIRKMGHAGTLDPLASGLMIIGIGQGTKKLKQYINLDKTYLMDVLLGQKTETGDLEGKILEEKYISKISKKQIKKVLKSMEGDIEMRVPIYSAIKIKGKPLYKYARAGVNIQPPKRKTKIYYLKFLELVKKNRYFVLKIEMRCSKGTYARSVAEEIGKRLGYPATLKYLKRTSIGNFDIANAQKLCYSKYNRIN